ncbi:hypothetical protein [uncultured Psychroserpens sp.]|uniref:hypothetical protein n=1 Tax=uncultured Psychroserpens sp. TaxID=255436 RepID=UPI00260F0237|nr:hypothetical protein [uncultured Psychroserpens sp.]
MEKIVLKISDYLYSLKLLSYLEAVHKVVLIVFILCAGYLTFSLNGNEEQYMTYAKQFMDPDWISSRYLNEFAGTRVLYQYIVGFFLEYFSFETVRFVGVFILAVWFALPLSKLYDYLKLSNVQILLHLPILYLLNQSMFAGSWMMLSLEPKCFSYIFVLYAINAYLRSNFKRMLLFLIIATYFHVLVGGYVFAFIMASLFFFDKSKSFKFHSVLAIVYVIALLPFVLYLKTAVTGDVNYSPSPDWIYSYFRSPHHVGLFRDLSYFYSKHFYGVMFAIVALLISLGFFKYNKNYALSKLNHFVFLSLIGVLLSVVIAYFDKEGKFVKYYPFRINATTTFLFTLIISQYVFVHLKKKSLRLVRPLIAMVAFLFLLKMAMTNIISSKNYLKMNTASDLTEMSNYIKENTDKEDVILSFVDELSLNRRMQRDRFVVYKFIPADLSAIPEWYERELFKRKVSANISQIKNKKEDYRIDYILTTGIVKKDFFQLEFNNSKYYLYKLKLE